MASRRSVYLLLGSNLQNPKKQLVRAKAMIEHMIARIIKSSGVFKSEAWGLTDQPAFYNEVIKLHTTRSADTLLRIIKSIESTMGRVSLVKWGPRLIDIDILFLGNEIIHSRKLIIPHPRIKERRFTLLPMTVISPGLKHPVYGKSMIKMLDECSDPLKVTAIL